jgi:hypothetical protein
MLNHPNRKTSKSNFAIAILGTPVGQRDNQNRVAMKSVFPAKLRGKSMGQSAGLDDGPGPI